MPSKSAIDYSTDPKFLRMPHDKNGYGLVSLDRLEAVSFLVAAHCSAREVLHSADYAQQTSNRFFFAKRLNNKLYFYPD